MRFKMQLTETSSEATNTSPVLKKYFNNPNKSAIHFYTKKMQPELSINISKEEAPN